MGLFRGEINWELLQTEADGGGREGGKGRQRGGISLAYRSHPSPNLGSRPPASPALHLCIKWRGHSRDTTRKTWHRLQNKSELWIHRWWERTGNKIMRAVMEMWPHTTKIKYKMYLVKSYANSDHTNHITYYIFKYALWCSTKPLIFQEYLSTFVKGENLKKKMLNGC